MIKSIIRPIVILPTVAGIVISVSVFVKIWETHKVSAALRQAPAPTGSSLPPGKLVNLETNADEYAAVTSGRVLLVFLTTNCDACKHETLTIGKAVPMLSQKMKIFAVCFEERDKVGPF